MFLLGASPKMDADILDQLEDEINVLAAAGRALIAHCRNVPQDVATGGSLRFPKKSRIPPDRAFDDARESRRSILSQVSRIQVLLQEPADFLQQLAKQNQMLACLRWLGEFQIIAFIPLDGSAATGDVADIAGVPEDQLARVVRMTATAGFLRQPEPDQVAHTALSAAFVEQHSLLDAALFFSEVAAPSALHMAAATQHYGRSRRPDETAYNIAFKTTSPFSCVAQQRLRLQRQWPAYLRYCAGGAKRDFLDIISQYNWGSLGSATVVEVEAPSTINATALAELYPSLSFIVQTSESAAISSGTSRVPRGISVRYREPGSQQKVVDAAVYILHLPSDATSLASAPGHECAQAVRVRAELRAHVDVLRANPRATMLLLPSGVLPSPGAGDPGAEATARLRDLTLWQLANERELETAELLALVGGVRDGGGGLVVVGRLNSTRSAAAAFEVRYQPHRDGQLQS